jgi:carbonic anhydrase
VKWKAWLVSLFLGLALAITQVALRDRTTATCLAQEATREGASGGDASAVLDELLAGNRRFVEGKATRLHADPTRVHELASGQHPRAVVLACADSRCVPEIVLDQGLGDLFTVRVAGNVLDPSVTGSVEYAVEHLKASLLLVLGHARCGAVTAALAAHGHPEGLVSLGPNLERLVEQIEPVIATLPPGLSDEDRLGAAIEANVLLVKRELEAQSAILAKAIEEKRLTIVPAVYDLAHEGRLKLLAPSSAREWK